MRYWTQKNVSLAIFFGKAAVNNFQQIRSNIRGLDKELRQSFSESKSETYRRLADLLAQQGRLTEAEQVLNLLKEAEYLNSFVRRDSTESAAFAQHTDLTPAENDLEKHYREIGDKLVPLEPSAVRCCPRKISRPGNAAPGATGQRPASRKRSV